MPACVVRCALSDVHARGKSGSLSGGGDLDEAKERLLRRFLELARAAPDGRVQLGMLGELYKAEMCMPKAVCCIDPT